MTTTLYLSINKCIFILFGMLFSTLVLIIVQTNPVYAVFSVILSALTLFSILLLIGAEFFALLILIIYTGVITVLFLFVVIMYNLREVPPYIYNILFNPFFVLMLCKGYWINKIITLDVLPLINQTTSIYNMYTSTLDIVQLSTLFNDHYFLFLTCGLLLFIAIIGSIVITYPFFKYQK